MSQDLRSTSLRCASVLTPRRAAAFAVLCGVALPAPPAVAADRWEEAGSGAVAILPAPQKAVGINAASLACAEQKWSLRLRTEPRSGIADGTEATVSVDRRPVSVKSEQTSIAATIPVSQALLEAMETGTRLVVTLGAGDEALTAIFNLRNSQKVIDAVSPRCSPVDMTGYEHVALSATDAGVDEAKPLLEEEIERFRTATSAVPVISTATLDRGAGRTLLFATLCGSSWYYGRSGCSLFGYARDAAEADWRFVYNSEGMALYLDPKVSRSGWPDLVTLQAGGSAEAVHWSWTGADYAVTAGPDTDAEIAGDTPSFHFAQ